MSPATRTLELALPPSIPVEEARLMMAAKLFEQDRLTLGQAAALAGYSKRTFMELLGKMAVPVFKYSTEELEKDLAW